MGVWRYCECGAGQAQITIEDLDAISWDEIGKVRCETCDEPRSDDTPNARIMLLVREIKKRDERLERLDKAILMLGEISRKIVKRMKA